MYYLFQRGVLELFDGMGLIRIRDDAKGSNMEQLFTIEVFSTIEYVQSSSGLRFELRKNDRNYEVGDYLYLEETVQGIKTGRMLPPQEVIYILYGGKYGLEEGYVIMQLK